jgi:hypothetical protein
MALAQVSIELIAIYFHFLEIFNIQIGEMTFCKPDFIIIKSNYFQKGQSFLDAKCHFEVSEFKNRFFR